MLFGTLRQLKGTHYLKLLWKSTRRYLNKDSLTSDIYVSTCHNIFYNLAFEDWIYENVDFNKRNLLFLWRNQPCIVIGRHQNPWVEVNIEEANRRGIPLARRKSGGGTVYHDLGNLNCTFFTAKKSYDRDKNLELVVQALKRRWGLDVHVNNRDDIILNHKYKISGTAAKLGKDTAYHHFTLLMDVDKTCLNEVLHSKHADMMVTKATESVRAEVKNLCDIEPDITYDELVRVIAEQYSVQVLGQEKANPVFIDPSNSEQYPEITTHYEQLQEWGWKYGWTPKFTVQQTFTMPKKLFKVNTNCEKSEKIQSQTIQQYSQDLRQVDNNTLSQGSDNIQNQTMARLNTQSVEMEDYVNVDRQNSKVGDMSIEIEIVKGCFHAINIKSAIISDISSYSEFLNEVFKGKKFSPNDLDIDLSNDLSKFSNIQKSDLDIVVMKWVIKCLLDIMPDVR